MDAPLPQFRHGDDFFELVRAIERHARQQHPVGSHVEIGGDGPPEREAIRFHTAAGTAFPGRAIESLRATSSDPLRVALEVSCFGLDGPAGVLPSPYSRLVQSRLHQRDSALADFLAIFNHRLIALFYRAWSRHRPTVQAEMHAGENTTPPFTRAIQALAGQPQTHLAQQAQPFDLQLFHAGHFARYPRSGTALTTMLKDLLQAPVAVDAFIGQWLAVRQASRLRIGCRGRDRQPRLGDGVFLGRRLWDMQSRIRIEIGPVTQPQFEALLPGGKRHQALCRLLESYLPPQYEVELRFLVRPAELGPLDCNRQLGRNFWLQTRHRQIRQARLLLHKPRVGATRTHSPHQIVTSHATNHVTRK